MIDKEMWEQDIEFMTKLREENEALKSKIDKAIDYIREEIDENGDLVLFDSEVYELLEILKD